MSIKSLLMRLRCALNATGIPYMVTGSFASSIHGAPRASQDIDIVIAPTRAQLKNLFVQFPEDEYYISQDAALDALQRSGQFNLVDFETGWKVDFIIRKNRDFSQREFERRSAINLMEVEMDVASPEDVIIAKLEWAQMGASSRQIEDAAGIIKLQEGRLDTAYVERWISALNLDLEWKQALEVAKR